MRNKKELIEEITKLKTDNLTDLYIQLGKLTYEESIYPTIITTTTSGYKWQKVDGGFKDLTSGLVWKDKDEDGLYLFGEVVGKFGNKLPTKKEYDIALSHDLLEVISFNKARYWSASVCANVRGNAWIFTGASGYLGSSNQNGSYSVRCVGR